MSDVFFLKGVILGFVIAAPVGPIGVLCAQRTLTHGRRAGFFSGMGAATADAIYGFIAAFGLTFVADALSAHQAWLRIAGGGALIFLGLRTVIERPCEQREMPKTLKRYAGMYTSTFLLTLTNPMTILSFGAVFAGFGLAGARGDLLSAAVLIIGVFLGSGLWWVFLVGVFSLYRKRHKGEDLVWVNRLAGAVILGSGLLALASAFR